MLCAAQDSKYAYSRARLDLSRVALPIAGSIAKLPELTERALAIAAFAT